MVSLAFNSVPKKINVDEYNVEDIAAICPGSGAKCFSVLWGLFNAYKGKNNGLVEEVNQEEEGSEGETDESI